MEKKTIYYATGNAGKYEGVKYFLEDHAGIEIQQFDHDLPEIQSLDQQEIARDKALKAWKILQQPLLLDDAGMYFDDYHEFPGTMSKFVYHGLGFEGLMKLVQPGQRAAFVLTLAYIDSSTNIKFFEGKVTGTIADPFAYSAYHLESMPYATMFIPDGATTVLNALRFERKEAEFNPRVHALKKFLTWYEQR